jgi:tetratricopeptide (TPR) repeat protein
VDVLESAAERASGAFDDRKAVSLLRAALRACVQLPPAERSEREGRLTARLADMLRFTQAKDDAIEVAQSALAHTTDTHTQALLHQAIGRAQLAAKKPAQAIDSLKRALGPFIAAGVPIAILGLYADLARGYADLGDSERAIRELTEGLDMCTFGGGPRADVDFPIWRYLLGISQLMRTAGKLRDARTWCEHALYQAERREDPLGLLRCHSEKAWILREAEQARHFGDRLTTAEILLERARVRAARGQLEDARRYFDEALRLAQTIEWAQGISHAQRAIETLNLHASPA